MRPSFRAAWSGLTASAVLTLVSAPAAAQPVIDLSGLNPDALDVLQQSFSLTPDQLEDLIEDELAVLYGLVDVPTFLRLSANAQSMSNKGLGVDYASRIDGWVFGAAVSVAADAGDADIEDFRALADGNTDRAVPVAAGAQIALMAGYALTDRAVLFASGLYYPLDAAGLEGDFYNAGLHLRLEAVPGVGRPSTVHWGGLDVTTGFQLSRMVLTLEDEFRASGTISPGFDLDTVSIGTLELEQRAFTVPIELTTNLTLFYFLTLYGGVGLDIQLGDATMDLDLTSDLTTSDPENGGSLELGPALMRADDVADPDTVIFRVLGGVQLNLWRVKVFGQLNFLTADLTLSVAAGLRLVL